MSKTDNSSTVDRQKHAGPKGALTLQDLFKYFIQPSTELDNLSIRSPKLVIR